VTILDYTTAHLQQRQRQARTSEDNEEKKRRREEEKSGEQVRQRRYLKPGNAPASGREEKWLT